MRAEPANTLAAALAATGTTVAFGLPGGGPNLDVVGAFAGAGISFVLAHTETAACIMASTWGWLTDSVTATVVTRGPGAASAVNGAAQATLDRQPLLLVTDTVPSSARQRVPHQRMDQQAMLGPVTKGSMILGCDVTQDQAAAAIAHCVAWPPGCVHLDYDASYSGPPLTPAGVTEASPNQSTRDSAAALIANADRPIIIVGVAAARESGLAELLQGFGAPVLTTYQAVGVVPTSSDIYGGLFTNGASERPLIEQADLIITVGLDLVEPIPAPWTYSAAVVAFSPVAQADPYMPSTIELVGPPLSTLAQVLTASGSNHTWAPTAASAHNRRLMDELEAPRVVEALDPISLTQTVADAAPGAATVTVDAGAHFLAIMPLWPVAKPRQLLISNGLATMGYAVPAAIGAAFARPDTPVVALTGDGGLGMCLAELETIVRHELPVTVVVYNDATLSLIKIKQHADHGGAPAVSYEPIDFAAVARSMGMPGEIARSIADVHDLFARHDFASPLLVDARIDPSIYPHLIEVTRG